MQTANQQNNSSITPLSDPGSSSSSSSTQQNLLNENNNIGQQITYPPPQLQYLLANLVARNQAASNPSLASIVANMQLSNLSPPPEFRLPSFNFAAAVQQLIRNAVAAASNNQINNSGLLLRQQSIGNPNNIVGYPQIKEENSSTGTDSPEQHQNLYGEKGEEEEKFLVDPSIVMDEEDIEEGQEENENIEKTQQSEQQIENVKTTQRPIQRRPRVGGSSAKTAEVWRFFSERPNGEKAATCSICQKTIKATNSRQTNYFSKENKDALKLVKFHFGTILENRAEVLLWKLDIYVQKAI
uniref:BED-type domain-containing protein n=1 Tax=Meloidogyne incognita TaxID=6306 RepID=A0A914M557_MELIC